MSLINTLLKRQTIQYKRLIDLDGKLVTLLNPIHKIKISLYQQTEPEVSDGLIADILINDKKISSISSHILSNLCRFTNSQLDTPIENLDKLDKLNLINEKICSIILSYNVIKVDLVKTTFTPECSGYLKEKLTETEAIINVINRIYENYDRLHDILSLSDEPTQQPQFRSVDDIISDMSSVLHGIKNSLETELKTTLVSIWKL